MKLIGSATETEGIASDMDGNNGIYTVPALTGLGRHTGRRMRAVQSMASRATLGQMISSAQLWSLSLIRPTTFFPRLPMTTSLSLV